VCDYTVLANTDTCRTSSGSIPLILLIYLIILIWQYTPDTTDLAVHPWYH